jgi:outer membrane protein assembly factor BamD (BamD/ComL family)
MSAVTTPEAQPATTPELTDEQRKELLEQVIQRQDKLAESELEMVRIFLVHGKVETAQRRLRQIMAKYPGTAAATEAEQLLPTLIADAPPPAPA